MSSSASGRKRRKILIYGDSNTYGYDPSDFFGGPYPDDCVWTYLTAQALKETWEVIARGENGRRLPNPSGGYIYAEKLLSELAQDDIFAVMLGSNDLLITTSPDAEVPAARMEQFLKRLLEKEEHPEILILAPPHVDAEDDPDPLMRQFYLESVRMNGKYRLLAEKYGVLFADTSEWGVKTAFDHIHLSREGHRIFAEHMTELLAGL